VDLSTADKLHRTSLKVRLEDRACVPMIDRLEPDVDRKLNEGEVMSWQVEVSDPDGDLEQAGVVVKGSTSFKLHLEANPAASGSHLTGTLYGAVSCQDLRTPLFLEARDRSGFVTRQQLEVNVFCPSLIKTQDGHQKFEADEDEELSIPLVADDAVRLAVVEGPGTIDDNGAYLWRAHCDDGRGPLRVMIRGEHDELYGDPLELEVLVKRCKARFHLEEKGTLIPTDEPLRLEAFTVRRLRIIPERSLPKELNIDVSLSPEGEELSITTLTGQPDIFDVRCRREGESRTLVVTAGPNENNEDTLLPTEPFELPIECVPRGTPQ